MSVPTTRRSAAASDDVSAALQGAGQQGVQPVLDAFFSVLGPGGSNLLADLTADGLITTADIPVISTPDRVQFDFQLERDLTLVDQQVAFDIGLPGLGLDVDGGVRTLVGFEFDFGFGFSKTEGVYLDVSKNNELEIDFEVTIPNLDAQATLAFLQLDVSDDAADPSQFAGSFTQHWKHRRAV